MKALIQHNFNTGLGDFLNCIYEYYTTCKKLEKLGYDRFSIKFFIQKNVYLHTEQFWDIFNIDFFNSYFENVEIIENPITEHYYLDYTCINSIFTDRPGQHLWDLFLQNHYEECAKDVISTYSYQKPECEYLDVFNYDVIKKYSNLKLEHSLEDYVSLYYRTHDLQDNEESYQYNDVYIKNIVESNKKVYVASNSHLFKKFVKKYGDRIITYDILGEIEAGNHYNYNRVHYDNKELIKKRTEYVIYEMLTLSDSKEINFFTLWGRDSNFLLISKIKDTPIKIQSKK
jgi:hypothetical protein